MISDSKFIFFPFIKSASPSVVFYLHDFGSNIQTSPINFTSIWSDVFMTQQRTTI